MDEEDDDVTKELYKDVNVNLGNKDAEMTDADQGEAEQHNVSQGSRFEHVEEDAHVTLTVVHDTQKTEGLMKSSSILLDFTNKLLNFKNTSPANNVIASLMDTTVRHEETSSHASSLYTVPVTSHTAECRDEAQVEKREYIDLIDTSMRAIIKEEVNTQLPQILPQAVLDFATPVIEKNVTESLEVAVLAKSSSQPKSTYEAAASLLEFELTKIFMDKMKEHKSYIRADYKRE
ncbi:hypothetical protein Tco_1498879, partial [Tanacetum coccineum]